MKKDNKSLSLIVVVLLIGLFSQSFGAIFVKLADDVPPTMIATYRMLFSSLLLICFFVLGRRPFIFNQIGKKEVGLSMLSGFFVAMHFISWIHSLQLTTVASSVMIVNMNAIFVGILAYLFFGEKQNLLLTLSIITAFTGCFILTVGDNEFRGFILNKPGIFLGNLLALCGALASSFYLLIGSRVRARMNILPYITLVYTSAALQLIMISSVAGLKFTGYKTSSYTYMLLMAIFPQLIGHSTFNWALKYLKSSIVAMAKMGEPIFATILAYFFFAEIVNFTQMIGICLIFIAIFIAFKKGTNQ